MTTAFLYDDRFLDHDAGPGHPERKERLESAIRYLREQPWFGRLANVAPTVPERRWLEEIHESRYIDRAVEACRQRMPFLDHPDVGICESSYDVACLAAGGALALADKVMSGEAQNAFSLSRPPGHHAERNLALGFCLFNNVAIVARYLQKQHGLDKILILDWDVHHGNGTQHSFEDDPSVLYVSTHQYPYYPGTGAASETGVGAGEGATLNCPMPAGADDAGYERVFRERILPKIDAFGPEVVIISAGFDAHAQDPLAKINLSTEFFSWMSRRMIEIADKHAGGRIISLLEGGYDGGHLPLCIEAHLKVMAGLEDGS